MINYKNLTILTVREITGLIGKLPDPSDPKIPPRINVHVPMDDGTKVQIALFKVAVDPDKDKKPDIILTDARGTEKPPDGENIVWTWVFGGGVAITDKIL